MVERKNTPTLVDDKHEPESRLAATAETSAAIFERFAKDPAVDVEKFERFMAMWERERARQSEADFDAAMNLAQQEMEPVRKDAHNSQTNSKYASFEKLDEAVRPIYTRHGFALSFDTGDAPHPDEVRMLCYVSHKGGYKRPYKLDLPADGKGARGGDVMTRTHATVSATSYGQRVLLRMIFNIAVGGDDDGNRAGGRPRPPDRPAPRPTPGSAATPPAATPVPANAPEGYDAWLAVMDGVAEQGWTAFESAFNQPASESLRKHLAATAPTRLAALRVRARKSGK